MPDIPQQTFDQFVDRYITTVQSETGLIVDTTDGSAILALANASAVNNMYNQTQALQVALNSRLDTAQGDAVDSFVNQFSPPFTGRIQAKSAVQGPVAPTVLLAPARTLYLYVQSITKLFFGQTLRLTLAGFGATTNIAMVEPTIALTAPANPGDVVLNVTDTSGVFVGGVLNVTDGIFQGQAVVESIPDGVTINISPFASVLTHTFPTSTTLIALKSIVQITTYTFDVGTVLGDLLAGTVVRPTDMLEGLRFFRNNADASTPSIPAKTISQSGYIVQTRINAVQYEVIEDTSNPDYDSGTSSYKIPANFSQVFVKVQAVQPGTASNVAAHTVVVLPTPLTGVDGCDNPVPIDNGADQETETAVKARFRKFITGNATATNAAIAAAIEGVSTAIEFSVIENVASDGVTTERGNFLVLVSDSTGVLTTELFTDVKAAIELTRPITVTYDIVPPNITQPVIIAVIDVDLTNFTLADRAALAQSEIIDEFRKYAAGQGWIFNEIMRAMLDIPGINDVLKLTINGDGFDSTGGSYVVVGAGPKNGVIGILQLARPSGATVTVT